MSDLMCLKIQMLFLEDDRMTTGTQSYGKVTLSCFPEYSIFAENINVWIKHNNFTGLNVFSNFVKS